jgi:hypothetical protein
VRLINQELCEAFFNGQKLRKQNSQVLVTEHGTALIYHNSTIAQHSKGWLRVTLAGYDTRTTKDRLNALFEWNAMPYQIVHRNHQLMLLTLEKEHVIQKMPFGSRDMLLFKAAVPGTLLYRFDERITYIAAKNLGMTDGEETKGETPTENTE